MKIARAAIATAIYLSILVAVHLVHVRLLSVNVVFYAAIADCIVAVIAAGAVLVAGQYFRALGAFEKTQLLLIWILIGYALAISVPTVIDRSLSFYILEKLEQRGGGIRLDRFDEVFTREYLKEHRLVDVRLTEQVESGTVTIADGCVRLTPKGSVIASFSRAYRRNFLPRHRLLMGTYTDDLTDPFRNSAKAPDYLCR